MTDSIDASSIKIKAKITSFNKVAVASCHHQKSKLQAVEGAEVFWVAELRVQQLKIVSKSCFEFYIHKIQLISDPFLFTVHTENFTSTTGAKSLIPSKW